MKLLRMLTGVLLSCVLLAGCKPVAQGDGDQFLALDVEIDGIPAFDAQHSMTGADTMSITSAEVANIYVKAFQKSTRVHLPHGGIPNAVASLSKAGETWKGSLSLPNPSGDVVFLAYAVGSDGTHLYSGIYEITNIQDDPGLPFTITVHGASDGSTAAYAIGDWAPGGGWIFYDAGGYSTYGWRYMEAAPNTWNNVGGTDPSNVWSNMTSTLIGITDLNDMDVIGTGLEDTTAILDQAGQMTSAAKTCSDLVFNVMNDWFLPSLEELNMMYLNLYRHSPSLGAFSGNSYWASTEYSDTAGWAVKFSTGAARGQSKDSNSSTIGRVRPVRAF